jgi:hypothetical protein
MPGTLSMTTTPAPMQGSRQSEESHAHDKSSDSSDSSEESQSDEAAGHALPVDSWAGYEDLKVWHHCGHNASSSVTALSNVTAH